MSPKAREQDSATKVEPSLAGRHLSSHSREYVAIILSAVSAFVLLCLLSYDPRDPSFNVGTTRFQVSNLCGLIGSYVADALLQLLGLCSILIPLALFGLAFRMFLRRQSSFRLLEWVSAIALISCVSALVERFSIPGFLQFPGKTPGGAVGTILHGFLGRFLGSAGELVVVMTVTTLCILYLSKMSVRHLAQFGFPGSRALARICELVMDQLRVQRFSSSQKCSVQTRGGLLSVFNRPQALAIQASHSHNSCVESWCHDSLDKGLMGVHSWERISFLPQEEPEESILVEDVLADQGCGISDFDTESANPEPGSLKRFPWRSLEICKEDHTEISDYDVPAELKSACETQGEGQTKHDVPNCAELADSGGTSDLEQTRTIRVSKRADEKIQKSTVADNRCSDRDDYQFPPIDLLDTPQISGRSIDESLLAANAGILQRKLADLGIQSDVVEIHPGPVITMYELALAPGIPLRKVLNTSDDLAMALKSGSTRVVAPIHGKDTVGIEVPNRHREIVYFREIIESEAFAQSTAPLKVALGKGIDGEPFATSLTRMPHLMIAGATGTGKSVGLNCLICSWLMTYHPDDVKFLMVDPKKLELSYYQDIPHLIHPVVTDPEKVPKVLSWAIREMERRYDLLSKTGAKNIEGYNQQILSGDIVSTPESSPPEKLPYLIIIIDELAELMMVAAKDIEISIARLAQMARASGIHLIVATQRPSVDVITGVIKANFPARISYQVAAKPDSRTILDTVGAENLLGMGDMLFLPPGTAKLLRLHGAYVSENEIRRIADFTKTQRSPVYLQEIAKHMSEEDSKLAGADFVEDEKYDEAVELVTRLGHASISLIQRHMRIGYNRAARIIEVMEAERIIGPSDGTSRPREVLVRSLESISDSRGTVFA